MQHLEMDGTHPSRGGTLGLLVAAPSDSLDTCLRGCRLSHTSLDHARLVPQRAHLLVGALVQSPLEALTTHASAGLLLLT